MRESALPTDAIALYRSHFDYAIRWYSDISQETYLFDDDVQFLPETIDMVSKHERIWLLMGHIWEDKKWHPHRKWIRQKLEENYTLVKSWYYGSDMWLYLYVSKAGTSYL